MSMVEAEPPVPVLIASSSSSSSSLSSLPLVAGPAVGWDPEHFPCAVWNCNGSLTEVKIASLLSSGPFAFAALTESGQVTEVVRGLLAVHRLAIIAKERVTAGRSAGGVAVVFDTVRYHAIEHPAPVVGGSLAEMLVVELVDRWVPEEKSVRVAVVYLPPAVPHALLLPALSAVMTSVDVVFGDFNSRHSSWDRGRFDVTSPAACRGKALLAQVGKAGFRVVAPDMPTCLRADGGSVLDFALAQLGGWPVTVVECVNSVSDHRIVRFLLGEPVNWAPVTIPWRPHQRIRWSAVDKGKLEQASASMQVAFAKARCHSSVNAAASQFLALVRRATSHLPRTTGGTRSVVQPPNVRATSVLATAAWDAVHCAARLELPLVALIIEAKAASRAHKQACVAAADADGSAAFSSVAAWRLWQSIAAPHQQLPPMITGPDGTMWKTEKEIAEGFGALFAAKSATAVPDLVEPFARGLHWDPITAEELAAAILKCDTNKAADIDGMDAEGLRLLPLVACAFLRRMLDSAIVNGIPHRWRTAYVTPVLKPGKPPGLATSYRPVAITSILCRLLEQVVLRRLAAFVSFHPSQCGFSAGMGTAEGAACLAMALNDATRQEAVRSGSLRQFRTLLACMDFTDAFCRVRRSTIIAELRRRLVPEVLVAFLSDFLTDRVQQVRVGSVLSSRQTLNVGSPQGSVLGPWLWNVIMDIIIREVSTTLRTEAPQTTGFPKGGRGNVTAQLHRWFGIVAYADDSVIWLSGIDTAGMVLALQRVLTTLSVVCGAQGIAVSPKSSVTLMVRNSPQPAERSELEAVVLECGGLNLPLKIGGSEKFLGVQFTSSGNYSQHVQQQVDKAREMLTSLTTIRHRLSPATTRDLVVSLVHSLLLYAAPAWLPAVGVQDMAMLEQVWLESARLITETVTSASRVGVLHEAALLPYEVTVKRAAVLLGAKIRRLPRTALAAATLGVSLQDTRRNAVNGAVEGSFRDWVGKDVAWERRRPHLPAQIPYGLLCHAGKVTIIASPPGALVKEGTPLPQLLAANEDRYKEVLGKWSSIPLVLWSDGSVAGEAAAAGYLVTDGEAMMLSEAVNLGEGPCSFTAEHAALFCGLQKLLQSGPLTRPVAGFSDAQGLLAMLGRGPCGQTDELGTALWTLLLQVAAQVPVCLSFIFAHCEWAPHEVVDQLAGTGYTVPPTLWPLWYRDAARPLRRKLLEDWRTSSAQSRYNRHAPASLPPLPRFPSPASKFLLRMRTGVDPGLGGWKWNAVDSCVHCHASIGREALENGVEHLFTCPDAKMLAARQDAGGLQSLTMDDLWIGARWPMVLKYRALFIKLDTVENDG